MPEGLRWYERISPLAAWRRRRAAKADAEKKPPKVMKPRTYRPIHLATLIVLTVLALTVTGLAAWLMWDAAQVPANLPSSPDLAVRKAQLRVDVIRNILAVGAGTGGLVALFLALRRQYVKERVDHADQEHKTRTADDTKYDAAEKRITDLYVKAAEQLGSDKAPVRLAALYSLERLAQDTPAHRQTVVSLLCAYLRMPFTPSSRESDPTNDLEDVNVARRHEQEVRSAAQRILTDHLQYLEIEGEGMDTKAIGTSKFWPDTELDLSGALLIDFDLNHCSVDRLSLYQAELIGYTHFSGLHCSSFVNMSQAVFSGQVLMAGARFAANFFCPNAVFHDMVSFDRSQLGVIVAFNGTKFLGSVSFTNVEPGEGWYFDEVKAGMTGRHVWPKGYGLVPDGPDTTMGTLQRIKVTERGRSADPAEETAPSAVVPQQPTGRDPVDPQPSPDLEG